MWLEAFSLASPMPQCAFARPRTPLGPIGEESLPIEPSVHQRLSSGTTNKGNDDNQELYQSESPDD